MAEDANHLTDSAIYCTACGRPLGQSAEDQPDWATGPICGECYQEINFEDEFIDSLLGQEEE